ncbi:FecR family protein, partial [Patescibacteria group bacterium]|nr:FecR family protein [Patescibacteria group bacterium]
LAVTATLHDITGTVTNDGKPVTPASPEEERTISPGSVITTAPASSAILYFSDGSITYLDPETTLRFLPNSEVEKNDSDGIITKIRLKLTSGKIWNKVIRLASESEFNIETTAAIAGVRGTEFGIEADGNKIIVLSGTMVSRMLAPGEATATDQSFKFDNTSTYFKDPANQEAKGSGTDFKEFDIGNVSSVTTVSGLPLNNLIKKYYRQPYNNNLEPRLNEIDVPGNKLSFRLFDKGAGSPWYIQDLSKVHVYETDKDGEILPSVLDEWDNTEYTLNAAKDILTLNDASTFFQTTAKNKDIILFFEDQSGHLSGALDPVLRIRGNAVFTWNLLFGEWTPKKKKISGCSGTYVSHTVSGPSVVLAGSAGKYKAVAAYTGPSCNQDITSICGWKNPPNGTIDVNGNFSPNLTGTVTITCDFNSNSAASPPTVSIISKLNASCWGTDLKPGGGDDKGFWDDPACWILAAETNLQQDCDYACKNQLSAKCVDKNDLGESNWDDDTKTICMALANMTNPPLSPLPLNPAPNQAVSDASFVFAPYLFYNSTFQTYCYARHSAIDPSDLCGALPSAPNIEKKHRVCRCVQ